MQASTAAYLKNKALDADRHNYLLAENKVLLSFLPVGDMETEKDAAKRAEYLRLCRKSHLIALRKNLAMKEKESFENSSSVFDKD